MPALIPSILPPFPYLGEATAEAPSPSFPRTALPALNISNLPSLNFAQQIVEQINRVTEGLESIKHTIGKQSFDKGVVRRITDCRLKLQAMESAVARMANLKEKLDLLKEKIEKQEEPLTYEDMKRVQRIHKDFENNPEVIQELRDLLCKAIALDFSQCGWLDQQLIDALQWCPNIKKLILSGFDLIDDGAYEFDKVAQLTRIKELDLSGTLYITQKACKQLRLLFNHLKMLNLARCSITDADLKNIAPPIHIQALDLSNSNVTDNGLEILADNIQLKKLNLSCSEVTNIGLSRLQNLIHLRTLYLSYCQITDSGLQVLRTFADLRKLDLNGCKITDAGLEHLQSLVHLQELSLSGKLTDDGLKKLGTLTQLRKLILYCPKITDAGLPHLYALSNLQALSLSLCKVTNDGMNELKCLLSLRELTLYNCPNIKNSVLLQLEFSNRSIIV